MIKIEREDIERLNSDQLALLLGTLLFQEATQNAIPASCVYASSKICVKDGGEDGRVKWDNDVPCTDYFPKQFVVFQSTVTKMDTKQCENKILTKDKQKLQPRVEEVLDAGGTYVLFFNHDCNTEHQPPLIEGFRAALRRIGKAYADNADIRVYDSNRITQWTNRYLSAISQVCERVGKCPPDGIVTWIMWERYRDDSIEYVPDGKLNAYIDQLRRHLSSSRQTARIIGLPGLGKTRLALETFRPSMALDCQSYPLVEGVAYIKNPIENQLPATVSNWRCQKSSGILVVDNCSLTLHKKLYDEVRHLDSRMSLLTLGSNPDEIYSNSDGDYRYIKIERASDSVIEGMVYKIYSQLPKEEAARVVAFSQGFPLMAVLVGNSIQKGDGDFTKLCDDELTKQLLGPEVEKDHKLVKAIQGCAIFDYVAEEQYPYIEKTICGLGDNELDPAIKKFEKRGIISRANHLIRVIPKPLALRLAASWWEGCSPTYISKVIDIMPEGLVEPLCEQMKKLDFLPQAQQITEKLCGPQNPFGSAEVLNTEKGSLFFRALVEVNPIATANTLCRIYSAMPRANLLEVKKGRRNLIWALEKLAFPKETFHQAATVFLSFASAENESWGNNANGQFLQLFHIFLPGTEATLEQRTAFLAEASLVNCVYKKKVLIKALGEALETGPFHRMNGPEYQGTKPKLEEYRPKTHKEVYDYVSGCLNCLTGIAVGSDELALEARTEIAKRIFGLTFHGMIDEVDTSLLAIGDAVGFYWPEIYYKIREIIKREGSHFTEQQRDKINGWLTRFEPTTLPHKLKMLVTNPEFDIESGEGKFADVADMRAVELARECAANLDPLYKHLQIVYSGDQRKGYSFGRELGTLLENKERFIDESLIILKEISKKNGDPIVLAGFLVTIQQGEPKLVEKTLERMENDGQLDKYVNTIIRILRVDETTVECLVNRIKNKKVGPEELEKFTYGSVFDALSIESMGRFCAIVVDTEPSAVRTVIDILYMYCFQKKDRYQQCLPTFRKLILTKGILSAGNAAARDYRQWQEICVDLLKGKDDELALHAANEIVAFNNCMRFKSHFDTIFNQLLRILLKDYPEVIWPVFWDGLTSTEFHFIHNMLEMLKGHGEGLDTSSRVLAAMPMEYYQRWCQNNLQDAPEIFARIIPILDRKNNEYHWHPMAKHLIDHYGNNSRVLERIFIGMGPSSYCGSGIPIYQKKAELIREFQHHSNANVVKWVRNSIAFLDRWIEQERTEEEVERFTNR